MAVIDNEVDEDVLGRIPNTMLEREEFLLEELEEYVGMTVYNSSLKADVYISQDSIEETAHHAAKSESSTIAALNMLNVIEKAEVVETCKPKNNGQKSKFHFRDMYELRIEMRYVGDIKLMIGKQGRRNYMEYCITAQ